MLWQLQKHRRIGAGEVHLLLVVVFLEGVPRQAISVHGHGCQGVAPKHALQHTACGHGSGGSCQRLLEAGRGCQRLLEAGIAFWVGQNQAGRQAGG